MLRWFDLNIVCCVGYIFVHLLVGPNILFSAANILTILQNNTKIVAIKLQHIQEGSCFYYISSKPNQTFKSGPFFFLIFYFVIVNFPDVKYHKWLNVGFRINEKETLNHKLALFPPNQLAGLKKKDSWISSFTKTPYILDFGLIFQNNVKANLLIHSLAY